MSEAVLIAIIATIFPVFFVALWSFVLLLISRTSGWNALAQVYEAKEERQGDRRSMVSMAMGRRFLARYRNVMSLVRARDGLWMRPMWMFSLFHKPLFLPFSEMQAEYGKMYFIETCTLRMKRAPDFRIVVSKTVGDWIGQGYELTRR
jgi:hypothetical protein